jgi:HEAT repeat protein
LTLAMKRAFCIALVLLLAGCRAEPPAMAGGKWAAALRDPDAKVRKKAAFTLGNIGASDAAVLPALVDGLHDTDAGVRCEVILALAKYGSGAKYAIPGLSDVQEHDGDAKVREYAARAVEKLKNAN